MNLNPRRGLQHLLHESDLELAGTFTVWAAFVSLTLATLVRSVA
jgi:hypothetical protein